MGFLNKMKTVFGTAKAKDNEVDSGFVEDIINSVENIPFAASRSNVLYGGISELAGYHYFKTVVIGTLKLKTNKGAKLTITGDDFSLNLNSDMLELESEATDNPNISVTKIDFEIVEADIPNIVKSKVKSLELSAKKDQEVFSILHIEYDEEE